MLCKKVVKKIIVLFLKNAKKRPIKSGRTLRSARR